MKWPRVKRERIRSLLITAVMVGAVMVGAQWWQTRNLLPSGSRVEAPAFTLQLLDGKLLSLSTLRGRPVLIYFFAPWCGVCHFNADTLNIMRRRYAESELAIVAVALAYEDRASIEAFLKESPLSIPVLLGTAQVGRDYRVNAFPTHYILDAEGRVQSRSVGYTSRWGIALRLLF